MTMIFAIIAWFIIGFLVWLVFSFNMVGFDVYDIDLICATAVLFCWLWPIWLLALLLKWITKKIIKYLEDKEFKDD